MLKESCEKRGTISFFEAKAAIGSLHFVCVSKRERKKGRGDVYICFLHKL
jgi:hypothetical protein